MQESTLSKLLDQLLTLPKESEWLEFKQNNPDPREIGEYISALGNSAVIHKQERAYLVWGIDDDTKQVVGTKFNPDTAKQGNQALEMWLSQKLRPSPHFEFIIGEYQTKPIVLLSIQPVKEAPIKFDRVAYIRVGSHKTKLDDQQGKLKEFWTQVIAGDNGGWDERREDRATIDDLDEAAIADFLSRLKRAGRRDVPEDMEDRAVLEKLRLLVDDQPTRAAILLLGKDPRRFYGTAYIKAGRFKSATEILDDREFGGTLFQQIDLTIAWLQERMTKKFVIGKTVISGSDKHSGNLMERDEVWQYPLEALREALANAVCHRNYTSGTTISIRLYDDRLEMWNPGVLPADISPESLLHQHPSHPRNKLIADCFYNTKIIEAWGTGTVRMAQSLEAQQQPPPGFDVSSPNLFKVIMRATGHTDAELRLMGLNERQIRAIRYLQLNNSLTNAQYQEMFGGSKPTASRDLTELVSKKLITKTGITGKGTSYSLLDN